MNLFLIGFLIIPGWLVAASHDHPHPELEMGREIYLKRCKVCHGIAGNGKSFAKNALNPPPRNFTTEQAKQELTQKRMLLSVTNGLPKTAMMPWKDNLSADEIRAVVNYIRRELMGIEEKRQ